MTAVSVCVCTFRRPDGLRRLLCSLRRLDPATPSFDIVVVDNDAASTAAPVVQDAAREGLAIAYVSEPRRGIGRARNRSIAPATGEFVAFIDDDEEADSQWLLRLWNEVQRHRVDGGVGPVLPRLPPDAPQWLITGGFYERPRFPTGTILAPWFARTGNALLRRERLAALDGPFNELYDLMGGEDTDMYQRLIASGCRLIAVDDAIVYEHLSTRRASARWLLERRFLHGMGEARRYVAVVPADERPSWQRARSLLRGCGRTVVGLSVFPLSRVSGFRWLARAANAFGRFAFHHGYSYNPYGHDRWL